MIAIDDGLRVVVVCRAVGVIVSSLALPFYGGTAGF